MIEVVQTHIAEEIEVPRLRICVEKGRLNILNYQVVLPVGRKTRSMSSYVAICCQAPLPESKLQVFKVPHEDMLIPNSKAISYIDLSKLHDRANFPLSINHLKHLLVHNQSSILPGEALGLSLSFKV